MDDREAINDRITYIEEIATGRPGEAADELQTLISELDEPVRDSCEQASALLRNEDYPGCAMKLGETAIRFQRLSTIALVLRDEIRRRR